MKVHKRMRPLARCDDCGSQIWATNVFKTVVLPGAVGHLALVFRCPSCDKVDKAATSTDNWNAAQETASLHDARIESVMKGAEIDIESIENVDDLLAEWSVGPVLREDIMFLCKCDTCRSRLYES